MTQVLNPNIRFVHAPNSLNPDRCPYTGYTICYSRNDDGVIFTYALCMKDDRYSKSIGREMALKAWVAVSVLPEISDEESQDRGDAFLDTRLRYGYIAVGNFKHGVERLNIFSDQYMDVATMFDFKHSHISHNLNGFVLQEAILSKYPNCRV